MHVWKQGQRHLKAKTKMRTRAAEKMKEKKVTGMAITTAEIIMTYNSGCKKWWVCQFVQKRCQLYKHWHLELSLSWVL